MYLLKKQNPTSLNEKWGIDIQPITPLFSVATNGCEQSGRGSVQQFKITPYPRSAQATQAASNLYFS
jgi:hypothetical protein